MHFNPLSLYRERQKRRKFLSQHKKISIHSPYTGRDGKHAEDLAIGIISIHSPYTGRDQSWRKNRVNKRYFNPLSLYRERQGELNEILRDLIFQSTLPIQGETILQFLMETSRSISIHSPYTGRDPLLSATISASDISIHSPYTGRDDSSISHGNFQIYFNPLSLYRERQSEIKYSVCKSYISIHSPYTGRDQAGICNGTAGNNFNPLSLYRERLISL